MVPDAALARPISAAVLSRVRSHPRRLRRGAGGPCRRLARSGRAVRRLRPKDRIPPVVLADDSSALSGLLRGVEALSRSEGVAPRCVGASRVRGGVEVRGWARGGRRGSRRAARGPMQGGAVRCILALRRASAKRCSYPWSAHLADHAALLRGVRRLVRAARLSAGRRRRTRTGRSEDSPHSSRFPKFGSSRGGISTISA